MRKVYYVPSHLDPEDYKDEWFDRHEGWYEINS